MLSVLANRTYRHLFAAQILSLIGTGLTTVALGLLAYDLAGADAGQVLGIALAIKMIAYVGVSPFAGALAGLLPRRGLLVSLDVVRAGMVLLLPFATEVWQIYALVFLFQSFSAAFTPTFQATKVQRELHLRLLEEPRRGVPGHLAVGAKNQHLEGLRRAHRSMRAWLAAE